MGERPMPRWTPHLARCPCYRISLILHSAFCILHFRMRWVIGDIHGMVQPLATVLLEARRHDPEAQLRLCRRLCESRTGFAQRDRTAHPPR